MKKIWHWLLEFSKNTWNPRLHGALLIFLVITIGVNYHFDFEDSYLDSLYGKWVHWPVMALMQVFPFLFVCVLLSLLKINNRWYKSRDFWICTVVGFAIIGFDRSYTGFSEWIDHLPRVDYYFYFKMLSKATTLLSLIVPLLLFYWLYERKRDQERTWYGLKKGNTDLRPYFLLLGLASICIAIGTLFNDIQNYYPRYLVSGGNEYATAHNLSNIWTITAYELAYGSSFLGVELFFRGFLIMSFTRIIGPYAVLAMVPTYAFLHFGKPMTETISSVFGGYILGVVAYKTKNIHGGIIIHVGIAWVMELLGYLQRVM